MAAVMFLPNISLAHDSFPRNMPINPPLGEAERDSEKLKLLTERGRRVGVPEKTIEAAKSVVFKKYMWNKLDIKVCFWNGEEADQNEIMQTASVWENAVPDIKFVYKVNGKNRICNLSDMSDSDRIADIRINLNANDPRPLWNADEDKNGDWSYVGTQVYQDVRYPTTMNLVGSMRMKSYDKANYKFNVRHEFGHALALMHEHQREACKGWFNIKEIAKDTGWTEAQVKHQVESLPDSGNLYQFIGAYNQNSIMQYNFYPNWYAPDRLGKVNPCKRRDQVTDLSELDKIAVAFIYAPALNETPERRKFIAENRINIHYPEGGSAPKDGSNEAEKVQVAASLERFAIKIRVPERISIQVYPHEQDKDIVLRAVSNLGYPVLDGKGNIIRSVSSNVTKFLMKDPTTTVFYTEDVSDFDARFVAWSLIRQGVNIKNIQKYYPAPQNGYAQRRNLIQIGASIKARGLRVLTEDQILTAPLPMYGAAE
jgi:hypothetical protein